MSAVDTTVPAPTVGPAPADTTTAGTYTGRHRADRHEPRGTHHQVAVPVGPEYNPLDPADRARLAPTYWATRHLPAGCDALTGRLDPTAVLAEADLDTTAPVDTAAVLAKLRDDLADTSGGAQ